MFGKKSFLQGGVLNQVDLLLAVLSLFDLVYYAFNVSAATDTYQDYIVGSSVYNFSSYMYGQYQDYVVSGDDGQPEDESTGGRFRSLRVVRAIRAVRNQTALAELKTFMVALYMSLEKIADAAILVLFSIIVTAIAGVQLFHGILRNRCFDMKSGLLLSDDVCGIEEENTCPDGFSCLSAGRNPSSGSADNVLVSVILVVSSVTLSGWSKQMFAFMRAAGRPAAVFFVFQIFVLAIYLTNVFLAIVVNQLEMLKQSHTLQMTGWGVGHWLHRGKGEKAEAFNTWKHWTQAKYLAIREHLQHRFKTRGYARCVRLLRITIMRASKAPVAKALRHWSFLLEDLSAHSDIERGTDAWEEFVTRRRTREKRQVQKELERMRAELEEAQRVQDMYYYETAEYSGAKFLPYWDIEVPKWFPVYVVIGVLKAIRGAADGFWYLSDLWVQLAEGNQLERFTMGVVVINTLTMAMDHTRDSTVGLMWGDPCEDDTVCPGDRRYLNFICGLQWANIGCIGAFSLEMFIKVRYQS